MVRVVIQLTEEQHEAIRQLAFSQRQSIAATIRDMIDRALLTDAVKGEGT